MKPEYIKKQHMTGWGKPSTKNLAISYNTSIPSSTKVNMSNEQLKEDLLPHFVLPGVISESKLPDYLSKTPNYFVAAPNVVSDYDITVDKKKVNEYLVNLHNYYKEWSVQQQAAKQAGINLDTNYVELPVHTDSSFRNSDANSYNGYFSVRNNQPFAYIQPHNNSSEKLPINTVGHEYSHFRDYLANPDLINKDIPTGIYNQPFVYSDGSVINTSKFLTKEQQKEINYWDNLTELAARLNNKRKDYSGMEINNEVPVSQSEAAAEWNTNFKTYPYKWDSDLKATPSQTKERVMKKLIEAYKEYQSKRRENEQKEKR